MAQPAHKFEVTLQKYVRAANGGARYRRCCEEINMARMAFARADRDLSTVVD